MITKVFISFRFSDGKKALCQVRGTEKITLEGVDPKA